MTLGPVPAANMVAMAVTLIISVGLPIALMIFALKKLRSKFYPFLIGCGVMLVMALILESIVHNIVFSATGTAITGNIWILALYGGLMAALFEETGRFIAMKFFMKKDLNFPNGFMYGVGHGGFEAIALVGLTYIGNLSTSLMINNGTFEQSLNLLPEETRELTVAQISALWTSGPDIFYAAGVERIAAIALQIGMSLIMYKAVKSGKLGLAMISFLIHFVVDFSVVVINAQLGAWPCEIATLILSALAIVIALNLNKDEEKATP